MSWNAGRAILLQPSDSRAGALPIGLQKENILNNNYFLKRVDGDDVSIFSDELHDLLPQNVQQVQTKQSVSFDESIPVYLIILLIVVGILVGVLGTCSVLVFVDYKNNPKFDTSGVVTYTRRRNFDKLYVDAKHHERFERQKRQAALSRTPLPVPGRASRASRESELIRSSREVTENLRTERKN
uniref:Conserved plasma membrane protein n=1 Tax=Angiostrongylus cantonensis TaxID=6313 RepID=A0A0K0D9P3_ANGCA